MSLERAIAVGEAADKLPVESDLEVSTVGLNLERVPLAHMQRGYRGRRGQLVDGSRLMQRVTKGRRICVRVLTGVVDLHLVSLGHGNLPIVRGIHAAQRRKPQE